MSGDGLDLISRFTEALVNTDQVQARAVLLDLIEGRTDGKVTLEELIHDSMSTIGEGWEKDTITLAQVYMSGRICETLFQELFPDGRRSSGKGANIAITVLDDFHLLGKRIVKSILVSNGFEVFDYGTASVGRVVELVKKDKIDILLVSVLMLPSALRIKDLRIALDEEGLTPYMIVGGAPFRFDGELCSEVGANATGSRASDAVTLINNFLAGKVK